MRNCKRCKCALALSATITAGAVTHAAEGQTIIRVDADSTATTPDGSTWALAYKYLQDGLAAAASAAPAEVWVAEGIYYPDQSSSSTPPTGDGNRSKTFALRTGVAVLAGFDGSETLKIQRHHLDNITMLSGDLDGDGDTGGDPYGDDSYHVVTAAASSTADVTSTAVLDGFTTIRGHASNTGMVGGGLYLSVPHPPGTADACFPTIVRCQFVLNRALRGGGVGINVGEMNAPFFGSCEFRSNTASEDGGAVVVVAPSSVQGAPQFVNCLFTSNSAGAEDFRGEGGAVYSDEFGSPDLINCTVAKNNATDSSTETGVGGLFHAADCPTTPTKTGSNSLANCIVWDNDGIELEGSNHIQDSTVEDLSNDCHGLTGNNTTDPDFENPSLGDFHLDTGSPAIDSGFNDHIDIFADVQDINQDGVVNETLPDLDFRMRLVGGTDSGGCRTVDRGAYEFGASFCRADVAPSGGDGAVNVQDLLFIIANWGNCPSAPTPCPADFLPSPCPNGVVNVQDLLGVISAWGACGALSFDDGSQIGGPENYDDCLEICQEVDPEKHAACMDACFQDLCNRGYTAYCE